MENARLWEELNDRSEELAQLVERLSREVASKDDFLASVGHELRTPLTTILGFAELAVEAENPADGPIADYLNQVADEARNMTSVVEDLLATSPVRFGGSSLTLGPVDIAQVTRATLDDLSLEADTLVAHGPTRVQAHQSFVRTILRHVVGNARIHGGDRLDIAITANGTHVEVSISDGGEPIAPDDVSRIFEPYETAGQPRAPARLGLGLAIARRLARDLGGDLTYRPEERAFALTLLAAAPDTATG